MNKQEVIERLNNKLGETFAFQRSFEPLTWAHMECESKANAYMTAINYVEQLDELQKVKVPACVAEYIEAHRKWGPGIFIGDWLADNDAVDKWLYNNSEKENNRRFLIAVKAFVEGYEIEEEPKYRVKIGNGYFVNYQGRGCLISPHEKDGIMNFDSMKEANRTADTVGGTVEKV